MVNSGVKTNTGLGAIGLWINGMALFNAKDAFYWNGSGFSMGISATGWNRNAYYWEGASFDQCNGHPANVLYHNHVYAICMTAENASIHSKIVGYAMDGFPIYGPYAYTNTNGTGAIKRMTSSYILTSSTSRASGTNGTTTNGPPVNSTYPLGSMCEDYVYTSGAGDLDVYNGRICVTPEYPSGTYAYFVTIDALNVPQYPFVIGPKYYGVVASTSTSATIPVGATLYTGQSLPVDIYDFTVSVNNNRTASIRWVVGTEINVDHYEVQKSSSGSVFTTVQNVAATNNSNYQANDENLAAGKFFYRIKTTDRDGTYKYSSIVSINIASSGILIIHNNNAKDLLTIQSDKALVKRDVILINMNGQIIQKGVLQQGMTLLNMNIQTVYNGVYVVKVTDGKNTTTAKIILGN